MAAPVFSARFAVLLGALALLLFSLSILFTAGEDPAGTADRKAGPGAFSTSSLGYAALYDILERQGWQVERGDFSTFRGGRGLTVYAEPAAWAGAGELPSARYGGDLLVVLPKWKGSRMTGRSRWIGSIELLPSRWADEVLGRFCDGRVVRSSWPAGWTENSLGFTPDGLEPLQVIVSPHLKPLVATASGILVGLAEDGDRRIFLLSDPDVMANHGILHGGNAAFMLALLSAAMDDPSLPMRFDESFHGHTENHHPSPLALLVTPPFAPATALLGLTGLLLVWAGGGRFGRPAQGEETVFGKARLLDNSARLMEYAGHGNAVLRRYVSVTMRRTGEALHAPPGLGEDELAAWLDGIGRARGAGAYCVETLRRARHHPPGDAGRTELLLLARKLREWSDTVTGGGTRG